MARIRTIKPEFFMHEDMAELPALSRLLFIGLWTLADRKGRLEDRPKRIKAAILPYEDADVDDMLSGLTDAGFIRRYEKDGVKCIAIPSFEKHQHCHVKEAESDLPEPPEHGLTCEHQKRTVPAPGKHPASTSGREGKGTGREQEQEGNRKGMERGSAAQDAPPPASAVWAAYSQAYQFRYQAEPVRNAKVNGQLAHLCKRIPADEAPHVAAFYVGHNNAYYVKRGHGIDALLADAEKLRTEWATNTRMTETLARQGDKTEAAGQVWNNLLLEAQAGEA